jgi:hypothetical protein
MKMRKLTYIAAIALAFGVLAGLPSATQALTIGDTRDLGSIKPPEPASVADETHYVNHLIAQAAPSVTTELFGPPNNQVLFTYTRTSASCGTCPAAVFNSTVAGSNQVDLGTGGFTYLLAKYDGPHGVSEVWNVQGLTGIQTIPASLGIGLGLSHWTLFGGGGQGVPDGGTTVMLLGAALGTLGMARRFLKI